MQNQNEDETKAQKVTFYKRARGILKKCIELEALCGQKVYFAVIDTNKRRMIEYASDGHDLETVIHAKNHQNLYHF